MARERKARQVVVVSITLSDGSVHTWGPLPRPRFVGSWAMRQLPYGTDLQGSVVRVRAA